MAKKLNEIKTFNVRLPRETWAFLRQVSTDTDESLNSIIIRLIDRYRVRKENILQQKKTLEIVDSELML